MGLPGERSLDRPCRIGWVVVSYVKSVTFDCEERVPGALISLADRRVGSTAAWLRAHPGIRVVCRDGSAAYAEAITQGAPRARQVSDRWHLWHGLSQAVLKEVATHSGCWAITSLAPREGRHAATTRKRWRRVHDLLDHGVGLGECARRLNLSLNTVKRYARIAQPERLVRAPAYRFTLGRSLPRPPASAAER
jgi:Transposase